MTPKDAGKVVAAGLLELMPERDCAGCAERITLPGVTLALPISTLGCIVLYFCSTRCDTPEARFQCLVAMKILGVAESMAATQPKAEA